ncbi:hypothetical protein H6F51_01815 [Cyanobacteria bacterium FACHB-DQ100]|uniref:hypothetical protein n=1 Tax=Leptolyngbya sp. DQ-M1 TaxID=2933920 RepID=UPI0019BC036F|nr:hypothetical protein [Cyanobacteria bacterium FACHB-DQ100]
MITTQSFKSSLDVPSVNAVMEAACREAVCSPKALYLFMHRFVHYGRSYSFLVPRLAGIIGSSKLLYDPNCAIAAHAERAMDVAANVLTAALEEFRDPRTNVSHRTLSYGLLDKLAEYAGLSQAEIKDVATSGDWLAGVLKAVNEGYDAQSDDLSSMVRAMGFHVGAEIVGEYECSIINEVLYSEQRQTQFGQFIKQNKLHFEAGSVSPWYWIVIHGTFGTKGVELKHSDGALLALNQVVQYADASEAQIVEWADQGFAQFNQTQQRFFQLVHQELRRLSPLLVAI